MRWVLRILAAAAVLAAGMGNAQQQAPRLALVIGNAAYATPGWQLVNPVNDATLIATRLRTLGFAVTPLNNASKAQMEAAMASFVSRLRAGGEDAVGVFYYAGHAAEHDGANLLVPVDVTARSMDELRYQAPPLNFVLRDMARAGNKVNIVVLDACRNLPLPSGTRAGAAGGLSDLDDVPTNVLLAYATRAGATAPDNPGERNSVFTRALAEALAANAGDPLEVFFANVQSRVATATGFQQRPEFRSQLLRAPGYRLRALAPASSAVDPEIERLRRENDALRRANTNSTTGRIPEPATPAMTSSSRVAPGGRLTAAGWLGVQVQPIDPEIAKSLGLSEAKGAIVATVTQNSPSSRAGLQQGDVVLSFNGQTVEDSRDLTQRVGDAGAGSNVRLGILSNGQRRFINVLLAERPAELASTEIQPATGRGGAENSQLLGASLRPLTAGERTSYRLEGLAGGLMIDSVAASSVLVDRGVTAGTVVLSIDRMPVPTVAELDRLVSDASNANRPALLHVQGQTGPARYLAVRLKVAQ